MDGWTDGLIFDLKGQGGESCLGSGDREKEEQKGRQLLEIEKLNIFHTKYFPIRNATSERPCPRTLTVWTTSFAGYITVSLLLAQAERS